MTSQIRTAFTTIANTPITYTKELGGDVTVLGKDINATPNSINSADLPYRTIRTYSSETGVSTIDFTTAGGCEADVTWQVIDTFYLKPIAINQGPYRNEPDLVRYLGAYNDTIRKMNRSLTDTIEITNLQAFIGVQKWPQESIYEFEVVRVILTLTEHLQDL